MPRLTQVAQEPKSALGSYMALQINPVQHGLCPSAPPIEPLVRSNSVMGKSLITAQPNPTVAVQTGAVVVDEVVVVVVVVVVVLVVVVLEDVVVAVVVGAVVVVVEERQPKNKQADVVVVAVVVRLTTTVVVVVLAHSVFVLVTVDCLRVVVVA